MRRFWISTLEVLEVVVVAVCSFLIIRTFLVQPFLVSGASMAPNFSNGDYLLIDELSYRLRAPQRGEVVVFRFPNEDSTYFIKRVIGLPGEEVRIRDGRILVVNRENPDGFFLPEPYLPPNSTTLVRPGGNDIFRLGEGEYLVLGDNRSYSYDSRDWGILPARDIVGLARVRLWPPDGFSVFAAPQYPY